MRPMNLFAQLTKVDEEKRLVYGRIAQEVGDHSGEIMDYAKSKPHFEKWSSDISSATGGKSVGNMRAMHGNVAAGKAVSIDFNDAEKAIDVVSKVVDDQEWKKVLEGVYTGFSIGGKYGERWDDGDLKRYVAKPSEFSLVDRPCIPSALFFDVQKSDGTLHKVAFKAPESAVDHEVEGTADDVSRLGKMMTDNGMTVADVIIAIEKSVAHKDADVSTESVKKGLYEVSQLSQQLMSLYYLMQSCAYEAENEADGSGIPARLTAVVATLGAILTDMTGEEVAELIGETAAETSGTMAMAAGLIAELRKAKNVEESREIMSKHAGKSSNQDDGALIKIDKAVDEALEKRLVHVNGELSKAIERIQALEDQPAPMRGVLRVVEKGSDYVPELHKAEEMTPVRKADGSIDEAATAIKKIHRQAPISAF